MVRHVSKANILFLTLSKQNLFWTASDWIKHFLYIFLYTVWVVLRFCRTTSIGRELPRDIHFCVKQVCMLSRAAMLKIGHSSKAVYDFPLIHRETSEGLLIPLSVACWKCFSNRWATSWEADWRKGHVTGHWHGISHPNFTIASSINIHLFH